MKELYKSISNRLKTVIEPLQHVDLYNNQYNKLEEEIPFLTPAVFIEFSAIKWTNNGDNTQFGECNIRIHIVQEVYGNTANPDQQTATDELALNYLDFVDQVHAALQGFNPTESSAMERIQTIPDTDHDNLVIYIHEYTCITDDETTDSYGDYVPIQSALKIKNP